MKKFKTYLFTILPFVLFGVYHGFSMPFFSEDPEYMRTLILSLFCSSVFIVGLQIILKNKMYFPTGILIFMAAYSAVIFALPSSAGDYRSAVHSSKVIFFFLSKPLAGLCLALTAVSLFPQLFKKPSFTEYFARLSTPELYWNTLRFKRINTVIGYFWAVLFFLAFLSQFIPNNAMNIAIPIVLKIGIGIAGTKYLQKVLMVKYANLDNDNKKAFLKNAHDVIKSMPFAFNAKNAEGLNVVIQYNITGENAFIGYLEINNGKCVYNEGKHPKPDLTVISPEDVWYKISMGELNGTEAFMKKLFQAEGDFSLMMKMNTLFGSASDGNSSEKKSVSPEPTASAFSFAKKYVTAKPNEIKKIVAIQSSPRKPGVSKTDIVLQAFLDGCKEAGAEVETIYLREKNIEHCIGCYTCWTKTPGKCVHKDDAEEITKKIYASDCVIYASPLYHFDVYSGLKKYIERTLPVMYPYLVPHSGNKTTHPLREGYKTPYTVVIGVCGFPEITHFEVFSHFFHKLAQAGDGKIIAELYKPASEILNNPMFQQSNDSVLSAFKKAGIELIHSGAISANLIEDIARIDFDIEEFRKQANMFWDVCISEKKLPGQVQAEFA